MNRVQSFQNPSFVEDKIVENKLKYWSQQLHDLSGRNRLLFYKVTRSSSATIEAPGFLDLFEILVERGAQLMVPVPKKSDFASLPDEEQMQAGAVEAAAELGLEGSDEKGLAAQDWDRERLKEETGEADLSEELNHPGGQDGIAGDRPEPKSTQKLKRNEMLTNHSVPELNRVMYNLRYMSRTVQEEQGLHILYVTFGMLKWKETPKDGFSYAPLILVPVQADREGPFSPYRIWMAEEDIVVNPVLQAKFSKDFTFKFPEVTNQISKRQLQDFLSEVRELIGKFEGWEVQEKVTLGAFNFMTQLLIKDFENYAPRYGQNPFVQVLSGVRLVEIPKPDHVPEAKELDDLVDPSTVFQILDADSSQQEAIEAAKRGLSFVLQGPPGTGKSQTIANIIVESIMSGKKILFVSQKMAALEVVQNRLDLKGLREFCLEIHSHKMDKRKVVRDLMDSLSNSSLQMRNPDYRVKQKELKQIRDELNSYVRQLHEPRFELGLSLYQAQGGLAQCLDAPPLNFSISNLEKVSAADLGKMLALVREVAGYPGIVENYRQDRWKGYQGLESPLERMESISSDFEATVGALEQLHPGVGELAPAYKLPVPETIQDDLDYLCVFKCFRPEIFSASMQEVIRRYLDASQSIKRYFDSRYREDESKLRAACRAGIRPAEKELSRALRIVMRLEKRSVVKILGRRVDDHAGGLDPALEKYGDWIARGFDLALSLFDGNDLPETLRKKYDQSPAPAADWFADHAGNVHELEEWANFNTVRQECNDNGLRDFVDRALEAGVPAGQWEAAFARRFYLLLIERLTADRPLLQKFRGTTQSELVRRFRELDLMMIDNSAREIKAKLYKDKPQGSWMDAGSAETSVLRREYNKKRRLVPLRKLFLEIPSLIQALKPCLMMSPLTVCQLLDPSIYQFDLAVFDEASQIPPEYAVSAFLRARQVIVAGDSQQLPPTNFFHTIEGGEAEEEEELEGATFESILSACDSCGFPSKMLNWHYRSKDESLIAYSNYHFYGNRLYTFPNPSLNHPSTGLKFVYVKDGVYKSGEGARYNLAEAKQVAELVYEHLTDTPELSLGIVAFSVPQRRAIEAEIEKLQKKHPDLNTLFSYEADEPVFIKNLENVQGDERDAIILSVGYGKDAAGKMALNFGPINRDGGARRLNVAVTRARYLLKLVSSVQPEEIDLARATSRGAWLLRNYLEAARDGVRAVYPQEKKRAKAEFDSLFEESVYNELSRREIKLVPQVGVSQYRIDLAVVDTERPERYLLGIECDGPMYYSALTARDRERLRQQVLEGLGWKMHRIWSHDWVQNREGEIGKVLRAIEAQKKALAGPAYELKPAQPEPKEQQSARGSGRAPAESDVPPGAAPYRRLKLEKPKATGRQAFLDAPLSQIIDMLQAIANAEGPISIHIARKLVLETWETRAGRKIDERLDSAIQRGAGQKAFMLNGNFLWPIGKRVAPLRIHTAGQPLRAMKDIAPEEIESAVRECVKGAVTIARQDLERETCRLFGLKTAQENVSQVKEVIESMLEREALDLENDKVSKGRNF